MKMEIIRFTVIMVIVLPVLWSSCCSAAPMECHFNSKALCEFQGRQFSLGETWMDDGCMHCTCLHPVGVGCCQTVHRPVDFPAWCEVRVEPVTCTVTLVQTVDSRRLCFPAEDVRDPSHGSLQLQQHQQLER